MAKAGKSVAYAEANEAAGCEPVFNGVRVSKATPGFMELKFVQTCGACPEQYDVFLKDVQVGYLRLRHGYFRVDCPDFNEGSETVYEHSFDDGYQGVFATEEREHFLDIARVKIEEWVKIQVVMGLLGE